MSAHLQNPLPSSDDESPHTTTKTAATSNPLGPYSPHLTPQNNIYTLQTEDIEAFLNLINDEATLHQKKCILQALCGAGRKVRIRLFREGKGRVVLGSWWDDCLSHLSTNSNSSSGDGYEEILVQLFHLSTAVKDMLKDVKDLNKARAKMGVDLVSKMAYTKKAFENIGEGELGQARAGFLEAERHFNEFYGVDLSQITVADAGGQAATEGTNATLEGEANISNQLSSKSDREEAMRLKRKEVMRKLRPRTDQLSLILKRSKLH